MLLLVPLAEGADGSLKGLRTECQTDIEGLKMGERQRRSHEMFGRFEEWMRIGSWKGSESLRNLTLAFAIDMQLL